jgi:hypothetical protein
MREKPRSGCLQAAAADWIEDLGEKDLFSAATWKSPFLERVY